MARVDRSNLLNISFEVYGVKELDRALGVMAANVKDLRAVWPRIRQDFIEGQREQFETEGDASGGRWPALSPAYKAWKDIHYPGKPILQRTGRLFDSLTRTGDADAIYEPGLLGLTMGSKVRYGGYHMVGTDIMPPRPPIRLTSGQAHRWVQYIQEHIVNTGQTERTEPPRNI